MLEDFYVSTHCLSKKGRIEQNDVGCFTAPITATILSVGICPLPRWYSLLGVGRWHTVDWHLFSSQLLIFSECLIASTLGFAITILQFHMISTTQSHLSLSHSLRMTVLLLTASILVMQSKTAAAANAVEEQAYGEDDAVGKQSACI